MSNKKRFKFSRLLLVFGLLLSSSLNAAPGMLVIKARKIYTAAQGVIENGMVLIENGKIMKVGKEFSVPRGIQEIVAAVVIPGLIDIHSHAGVYSVPLVEENYDGNEMTSPVTPQVRAMDGFNFDDLTIPASLAGGVTTVVSRPGSLNVIGGTSVAVKLKNAPPKDMVLKEICDLKMAIEGNPQGYWGNLNQMPSSMMGVYFLARKAFAEAQEYQKTWEAYEKDKKEGKDVTPPKRDLGKDVLVSALKREIPVHIHCYTASEIMTSIRLGDEFNLKLSLGHSDKSYLIVDELAKRKDVYINVGPAVFDTYYQNSLEFRNVPAILAEAGIKVSLQTDGHYQPNLRQFAALCVRYGMKEADALKSITINEAEAVGLEKRIGSIEAGKDADLVLLDGEPFEFLTSVETVIIDGKVEYRKESRESAVAEPSPVQASNTLSIPVEMKNAGRFALKGGVVYTMSGAPLKNGILLVKDGKIEAVGSDLPIPEGCPVIDAREFVVMPGLVAARAYLGVTSNWRQLSSTDEKSKSVVPEMEIKHAIEPQAPLFYWARELGMTSALVTPGNLNVIGGQGVVIKTSGDVVDRMVVKDRAVMVFGLGAQARRTGQMPSTRMGIAAVIRETLVRAQEYRDSLEKYEKDKKGTAPQRDFSLEALVPVIKGEMPVIIHCERKDDILTAMRLADEFKLKIILDGATDAYKVIDEIKKRDIPVILEDLFRGVGNIEDRGFSVDNPAILAKAGVRVAFRAQEGLWQWPGAGMTGGDLLEIAAFAHREGMPEEAALRAVTIDAARIAGIEARVGSLEPGKDADILVLRGRPFRTASIPEAVFVDGKVVYQRKQGEHLGKIE
jgi:imidazolonepropionase-like amidohydrolase